MEIKTLYKYDRGNGKITVSPNKPDCEHTEMYRVIADDGMVVTRDNETFYGCVDTDTIDGWIEVEAKEGV